MIKTVRQWAGFVVGLFVASMVGGVFAAIINPLPYIFQNGVNTDAGQMNADLAQIVSNVNTNGVSNLGNPATPGLTGANGISVTGSWPAQIVGYGSTTPTTMSTPANPTANATGTHKMMGLAGTIVPLVSGTVTFTVGGDIISSGGGCSYTLFYGTGTAPVNGAAETGTALGATPAISSSGNALPWTVVGVATGLSIPATSYWFDMSMWSLGGTCAMKDITMVAVESR